MQTRFAALALLAATAASANTVATGASGPPSAKRVEGRVGMLLGGSDVGDANGFSMGVSAGVGYRIGDTTLRALFDHYRVGDTDGETPGRRGRGTRFGGAMRYSLANSNPSYESSVDGVALDFWGEAGLGYEHVAWHVGGILDRPSGELAIGF
ncbi:MAG TPA: hypothetical protein VK427_12395, partial [Kofleriaceae bacterium]|nr:hypothetical protein [Kofleriaceae bacterium]